MPERRLSRESIGQRGLEIYQGLRPQLESCHYGRFVAIDVETGKCEVADESSLASDDLWDRCPRRCLRGRHRRPEVPSQLRPQRLGRRHLSLQLSQTVLPTAWPAAVLSERHQRLHHVVCFWRRLEAEQRCSRVPQHSRCLCRGRRPRRPTPGRDALVSQHDPGQPSQPVLARAHETRPDMVSVQQYRLDCKVHIGKTASRSRMGRECRGRSEIRQTGRLPAATGQSCHRRRCSDPRRLV